MGGVQILIIHDIYGLDYKSVKVGAQVIVSGHTHKAHIEKQDSVLLLNPGSAGYANRLNQISIAKLFIRKGRIESKLIELDI